MKKYIVILLALLLGVAVFLYNAWQKGMKHPFVSSEQGLSVAPFYVGFHVLDVSTLNTD